METGSGIYCFENILNGKKYVGQGQDVYFRIKTHIKDLNNGYDHCIVFKYAWNKYGEKNFKIYIVENCSIEILNEREIYWIKELHSHVSEWGYNVSWGGDSPMRGRKHSKETREKMVLNHADMSGENAPMLGKHQSEESRRKIGDSARGRRHSDETKRKLSEIGMGHEVSEDTRKKLSISNSGRPMSEDQKTKLSIINTGKIASDETKDSISKGSVGKKHGNDTSSKYVGVYYDKTRNKWSARITYHRKCFYLGRFDLEIDAAIAYNTKALELYGENVKLNIIIKDKEANE